MSGTTLVNCSFNAADGTALESYSNVSDTNATWVKITGSQPATIQGGKMALGGAGVFYRSVPMTVPDYDVFFQVWPTSYTAVTSPALWAIARNAGDFVSGYKLQVAGDGTQYNLQLVVGTGGTTAISKPMGTIASGYYQCSLTVAGSTVSGNVQRSVDGLWLSSGGMWVTGFPTIPAIVVTDTNYTAPGYVVIGGETG